MSKYSYAVKAASELGFPAISGFGYVIYREGVAIIHQPFVPGTAAAMSQIQAAAAAQQHANKLEAE
jgi:hypothetical protein